VPGRLKPRKYRVDNCSVACSLNPRMLPAGAYDAIHRWVELGSNNETVVANALSIGVTITERSLARHKRNHMVPEDHLTQLGNDEVILDPPEPGQAPGAKLSDLQILDKIIQAGAKQLGTQSVRISPEMTMKAMELRLKITNGSVFDDFMSAVGKAFGAPDTAPSDAPETPEALAAAMEQMQGAVDDGPGGNPE
jgi:hypothetical protein